MLSSRFSDVLTSIAGVTEEASLFVDVISRISAVTDSFLESAGSASKAPANLNIQGFVRNGVHAATQGAGLWGLYESCKAYRSAVSAAAKSLDKSSDQVDYLLRRSNDFLSHYERYMAAKTFETAFDLLVIANELNPKLVGLNVAAELADENFGCHFSSLEDSELEIVSDEVIRSPEDLVRVLAALSEIYAVLAGLLKVSVHQEPLRLEKIESGSLYLKLKGAVQVMRATSGVLKRAFAYGVSNHTLSGRFDQISKASDGVERVLHIRDILAAQGADVSKMDAEIEGAALKLATHANTLIGHMHGVGLNGEVYEVRDQLLLAKETNDDQKLLGHKDDGEA